MVLFGENGHLAQKTLDALHNGTLDEGERLEVSEHLCLCDLCMQRYADSLTETVLLVPPEPLAPGIAEKMEQREGRRKIQCAKRFAVALCCVAGIWLLAMLACPARKTPVQIDRGYAVTQTTTLQQQGSGPQTIVLAV